MLPPMKRLVAVLLILVAAVLAFSPGEAPLSPPWDAAILHVQIGASETPEGSPLAEARPVTSALRSAPTFPLRPGHVPRPWRPPEA